MRNSTHSRWSAVALMALLVFWAGCGPKDRDRNGKITGADECLGAKAHVEWNAWRARANLPAARCSPSLVAMARARQVYLKANGASDSNPHSERPGRQGYSGATLEERATTFGVLDHKHWLHEGLVTGTGEMVQSFVDSVYHRALIFAPGMTWLGTAEGPQAAVALVKELAEPSRDDVVHYPFADDEAIPLAFDTDREWPDPALDEGVVGYPLSVFFSRRYRAPESTLVVHAAAVWDERSAPVAVTILHSGSDDKVASGSLHLLPREPLQPGTQYRVHIDVTHQGRRWEHTWFFRTRLTDED